MGLKPVPLPLIGGMKMPLKIKPCHLRAAGFAFDGVAGGKEWTGQRRRDYYVAPAELKHRWMKRRAGERP